MDPNAVSMTSPEADSLGDGGWQDVAPDLAPTVAHPAYQLPSAASNSFILAASSAPIASGAAAPASQVFVPQPQEMQSVADDVANCMARLTTLESQAQAETQRTNDEIQALRTALDAEVKARQRLWQIVLAHDKKAEAFAGDVRKSFREVRDAGSSIYTSLDQRVRTLTVRLEHVESVTTRRLDHLEQVYAQIARMLELQ